MNRMKNIIYRKRMSALAEFLMAWRERDFDGHFLKPILSLIYSCHVSSGSYAEGVRFWAGLG